MNRFSGTSSTGVTCADALRGHAARTPDRVAYTFLADGNEVRQTMTWAELDRRARAIGAHLQHAGGFGARVLLLYPPGLEYIAAFMGCQYAGAVAVPAYPPQSSRIKPASIRLQSIVADAQPALILTLSTLAAIAQSVLPSNGSAPARWVTTDAIANEAAADWTAPDISSDAASFLQYTSGSTTTPKGVIVTHGNLLHNERLIATAFGHTDESIVVGWLPLYHDMGLIGNVLQPLYRGLHCVLMPPIVFLQNPVRWLSAITRYRATTSGAPNFAYELCVNKIDSEERAKLDLGSWKVAYNGAEPVRAETLDRFVAAFGPRGFRRESFLPCYGLAEATLFVSGNESSVEPVVRTFASAALEQRRASDPAGGKTRTLVGCGSRFSGQNIVIVDPESLTECEAGQVGEIWISGDSVAGGYWGRLEETKATFRARTADGKHGPCLRTGDLGFFFADELFIAGRLKDLIIIRGRNHYPQDIELTVEKAHPALRPGCGAAFSIEVEGEERLAVIHEVERQHRNADLEAVIQAVHDAIAEHHELIPHAVVLVKPGTVPKTSSGKIQRYACRDAFVRGSFDVLACELVREAKPDVIEEPRAATKPGEPPEASESAIRAYLVGQAAQILKIRPSELDPEKAMGALGFDSLKAIELAGRIESTFGVAMPMAKMFETPSLSALSTHLFGELTRRNHGDAAGSPGAGLTPARPKSESRSSEIRTFPASADQLSLWLLDSEPRSVAYNILVAVRLKGFLDRDALERSLNGIIERHEILRTTYAWSETQLLQVIAPPGALPLTLVDLGTLAAGESESEMRRNAVDAARQRFSLADGPLIRPLLHALSPEHHVLTLTIHHIACDGWSVAILLRELSFFYEAFSSGETPVFEKIPPSYAECVARRELPDGEVGDHFEYWLRKLKSYRPELLLPTDRPKGRDSGIGSACEALSLPSAACRAVKRLGQEHDATPFMVLLAAFQALLSRCSGEVDLVVGSSVANRDNADSRETIGPFTNAVALRSDLSGDPDFLEILRRIRRTAVEAFAHQEVPFGQILKEIGSAGGTRRNSAFNVVFLFQGFLSSTWHMNGIIATLEEFDTGMSSFDLALVVYETNDAWTCSLRYRTDLFERETIRYLAAGYEAILEQVLRAPETALTRLEIPDALTARAAAARLRDQPQTIVIAATFTAELIEAPLNFWMQELDIPARIAFAPFNQVFQQLLDPGSLLGSNQNGINAVLLRFDDLLPDPNASLIDEERLVCTVDDMAEALQAAAVHSRLSWFVLVCPSASEASAAPTRAAVFRRLEDRLTAVLKAVKGVYCIATRELLDLYPVFPVFDPDADALGRVPYQPQFFTALGTMIARRMHVLRTGCKVVVLDCDETLWGGRCGEDGAAGVDIDVPQAALQRFMVEQHESGRLLCLCSKNHEADVEAVFQQRVEMILKNSHIAARKINWESKTDNVRALSDELRLGLDAFVFVDDSPLECAEMRAVYPQVLTIQLPHDPAELPQFLRHAWVFDCLEITEEDRKRTALYRQNLERERFRRESLNLETFLAELELTCEIRTMAPEESGRVAQLAQRTNQFNSTGLRYSEPDIRSSLANGQECIIVRAADRFGDYGLVGMMLVKESADALEVESFLLSCRALGRGIERQMLSFLGEFGVNRGATRLAIAFQPTTRNQPARDFLEEFAGPFHADERCFRIAVDEAIAAKSRAAREFRPPPGPATSGVSAKHDRPQRSDSEMIVRIATQLREVAAIDAAIAQRQGTVFRSSRSATIPATPTGRMLAGIWSEVLRTGPVGNDDNFFELGGNSLQGTVIVSRIRKVFGLELPLHILLENPTIGELSAILEEQLIAQSDLGELTVAVEQLSRLSDEEVRVLLADEAGFLKGIV